MSRYKEEYEYDDTPSDVVVRAYRESIEDDSKNGSLALVTYRGTIVEFNIARQYIYSADPLDRATGADVLGQLGWDDRTFLEDSIELLVPLLRDPDDYVVYCAAVALGHRSDPSVIPHLVDMVNHICPLIRLGVAYAFVRLNDDSEAIHALISLSRDADKEVRNWALFGLGTALKHDTWDVRDALFMGARDEDGEARGEAILGLAERDDSRVVDILLREWENDIVGLLSVRAAQRIGDPQLLQRLEEFANTMEFDDDESVFRDCLEAAIAACSPK